MQATVIININNTIKTFETSEDATAYLLRYNKLVDNQKAFVLDTLRHHGRITHNYALAHLITRLSAIIAILKDEGIDLEGTWGENNVDYIYSIKVKKMVTNIFGEEEFL